MLTIAPNVIDEVGADLWWSGKTMDSGTRSYLETRQAEIDEDFEPQEVWECKVCGCITNDARIIEDDHGYPQYVCSDCVKDAVKAVKECCEPVIAEYLTFVLEDLWRADR